MARTKPPLYVVRCSEYITSWHMSQSYAEKLAAEMNSDDSKCPATDHAAVPLADAVDEIRQRGYESTWDWEDPDGPDIPLAGQETERSGPGADDTSEVAHQHS